MGEKLTDIFLLLFCEKNSDGTKKLRLKGKDLYQRLGDRLIASDMRQVSTFLNDHPEVNEVNLSYNDIGDDGLEILCDEIFSKPNNLEHINLIHCDLTEYGAKFFYFMSQKGFVKLKTLRLSGNKFGPSGLHIITLSLDFCPNLDYLDVGDTDLTAEAVDNLFLKVYVSQIKILNISRVIPGSMLDQYDTGYLAAILSELLRLDNVLVELHVQKCELDGRDIESMLEGLYTNTSLKLLDLGYNNIGDDGVLVLCKWLKSRPNLIGLNVAGNKVKDRGGVQLSMSMPFSKLRFLDISYNRISDKGLIAILDSIVKPFMLRYFYIWGNTFGHKTNKKIERLLSTDVLWQEGLDVKLYYVDGVLYAARYTGDNYKHRYYDVMDYGCPVELKIKKNRIEKDGELPKALIRFQHMDRFPPLECVPKLYTGICKCPFLPARK